MGVNCLFCLLSPGSPKSKWLLPISVWGIATGLGLSPSEERSPRGGLVSSNFTSKSTFSGARIPMFHERHKIPGERKYKQKPNPLTTLWCREGKIKRSALQGCNLYLDLRRLFWYTCHVTKKPGVVTFCGSRGDTTPGETLAGMRRW